MNLNLPMSRDVICVSPDDSLRVSRRLMDEWKIHHLPVVVGRRVVGVISDRDILLRSSIKQDGKVSVESAQVQSVMTTNPVMCDESESLANITTLMSDRRINSVLIVNKKRQLIGIITSTDILEQFRKQQNQQTTTAVVSRFTFTDYEQLGITPGTLE